MKKTIFIMLAIALLMLLPELAINLYAPPVIPPTGTGTGAPIGGGPTGVPIDGGLGFLAAAGIAYAGKKLHERKQSKETLNKTEL